MSTSGAVLQEFAYGEHLEGVPPRSLGYCLLAPAAPRPWTTEVEALARGLHATLYPDPWPPVELFCSVLLAGGQRVVAVARYGLSDHTASRRRGGLELVGVVAPGNLSVSAALGLYRWLRQRRAAAEDLRTLGGDHPLDEVLTAAPPCPPPESAPVLPVRPWQEGVLLFAATSPSDPDNRLGLLAQEGGCAWQWLPLCGADFPLQTYAQRGPLVAWTPHLTSVAVKLDRKPAEEAPRPGPRRRGLFVGLAVLFLALMAGNLWALLTLPTRLASERPAAAAERKREPEPQPPPALSAGDRDEAREKLALALRKLLGEGPKAAADGPAEKELIERYQRLVRTDPELRVEGAKAQAAVGLVSLLARYSPDHVARLVQEELGEQEVMRLIGERVRARLLAEGLKR
jgi:hypothetical protein